MNAHNRFEVSTSCFVILIMFSSNKFIHALYFLVIDGQFAYAVSDDRHTAELRELRQMFS